jgi:hypothetical protein
MLVPITRAKFEQLIPAISTGAQYSYYWGKGPDVLRRLLISLVAVVILFILGGILGGLLTLLGLVAGLYWLWAPVLWASLRNQEYRRFLYSGFWQGQILDVFINEVLIGTEETVNQQGDLVIVENRERRINLEVGDETGFKTRVQVPLQRSYKPIRPGDVAEMLVFSNQPDLGRIAKVSDIYIPNYDLWVSDYPYLQRDVFVQVSRALQYDKVTYE